MPHSKLQLKLMDMSKLCTHVRHLVWCMSTHCYLCPTPGTWCMFTSHKLQISHVTLNALELVQILVGLDSIVLHPRCYSRSSPGEFMFLKPFLANIISKVLANFSQEATPSLLFSQKIFNLI